MNKFYDVKLSAVEISLIIENLEYSKLMSDLKEPYLDILIEEFKELIEAKNG